VAIEEEEGTGRMIDTIKISSNPEKVSTPGLKKVYRIVNMINHRAEGDYIAMETENVKEVERLKMFHPVHPSISKFVTNFEARELQTDIFVDGELVYELPDIRDIQQFAKENLNLLWDEYKRNLNPEEYPVDLSEKCWKNKMDNINKVKEQVNAEQR
jgi:nicotinate phosphoribosyltransferase